MKPPIEVDDDSPYSAQQVQDALEQAKHLIEQESRSMARFVLQEVPKGPELVAALTFVGFEVFRVNIQRISNCDDPRALLRLESECAAGCSYCCHQEVVVMAPYVLWLARRLRDTLSAQELSGLAAQVGTRAAQIRRKPPQQRKRDQVPCGLLAADGRCGAYELRPTICRGHISPSRAQCQAHFEDPDGAEVPTQSAILKYAGAYAEVGVDEAKALGLDLRPVELTAALDIALKDPLAETRWLLGMKVFGAAVSMSYREAKEAVTERRHLPVVR